MIIQRLFPRYRLLSYVMAALLAAALTGCGSFGMMSGDEVEPNNTMALADPVSDLDINGIIATQGDEDWFVLNAQEGVHPTFIIYHDPSVDIDFEVYNTSYGVTSSVGVCSGTQSGDSITVNTPGQVHIRVYAYSGYGPYRIQINP